tara:strand:- start:4237 stop:4683 length:447 start_codon:yes stop_codon:yes gene_type:complete
MEQLNFPNYIHTFKNKENKRYILDLIRKKYLLLTPEEWVRQNCINFLISALSYPKSLINVEKQIKINGKLKRYDIVVFNPDGNVNILVECKAPSISINQDTFDQIAQYNMTLNSNYLMLTNGKEHYFCIMNFGNKTYSFIKELPKYKL